MKFADDNRIPDDELHSLLKSVDLESLLDRPSDEVTNWGEVLSLGEQQRLGMARLFYHKPRFAILDECTSGVTVEMEERFCNAVKDMGCTCITISHRPALMAFHDIVLNLDGEGGWSLHQGHRKLSSDTLNLLSESRAKLPEVYQSLKTRQDEVNEVFEGMTGRVNEAGEEIISDDDKEFSGKLLAKSPDIVQSSHVTWKTTSATRKPISLKWVSIVKIIFGEDPIDSGFKMMTVSGVVILRTLLQDRIAKLNGRSVDLVLRQDLKGFLLLIGQSVIQSAASAFLAPSLRHVADTLALTWRSRLTNAIAKKYLCHYGPYTVSQIYGIDDVDQRITRDIERLSEDLAALVPTLVKPVADIAWFSLQLFNLTGPRGALILYSYALIGYGCLRIVTPDFAGLLTNQYRLEGSFRGAHERLRTHAESIAFFGGGEREGEKIKKTYQDLVQHLERLVKLRWMYGAADDFFAKQLPHSVTWILTLLYALDQRQDFGDSAFQGHLVLQIRYLASVVTQCFSAFGELLALPKRFAEISGGINRVSETIEAVERSYNDGRIKDDKREASNKIVFDHVNVITPSQAILANKLTFSLPEGNSLLITGPNGVGKTSIFRVLAGMWPVLEGKVGSPPRGPPHGIFYVPQRPYTTTGTLRDQVIYPLSATAAVLSCGGTIKDLDKVLDKLMGVVRLKYLIQREGSWDTERSWGDVLSLGEQQRIGMARMFFHEPTFAVLDDCTNAMSVEVEEALYNHTANELGINLITITQRTALVKYHGMELKLLDGQGQWELKRIRKIE